MNKKKITKILIILICVIAMFFIIECLAYNVNAEVDYKSIYDVKLSDIDSSNIVGKVLGIVQAAGYVSATIMLVVKGIQYIWSSPEGKAELKKQFIPYFIGMVILVSGGTMAGVIAKFAYN